MISPNTFSSFIIGCGLFLFLAWINKRAEIFRTRFQLQGLIILAHEAYAEMNWSNNGYDPKNLILALTNIQKNLPRANNAGYLHYQNTYKSSINKFADLELKLENILSAKDNEDRKTFHNHILEKLNIILATHLYRLNPIYTAIISLTQIISKYFDFPNSSFEIHLNPKRRASIESSELQLYFILTIATKNNPPVIQKDHHINRLNKLS